jgi:hypothetical protein
MKNQRPLVLTSLVLAFATACVKHSGDIALLPPSAAPVFVTRVEIATGTDLHADYVVADLNNNGILDMAVISLSGELQILFGDGARGFGGQFGEQTEQIDGVPAWIDSGDFDNDGDLDLAIVRSDEDTTEIYSNDGGTFALAGTLPVGTNALALAVGDLDQDGDLDIAVSRPLAPEILVAYGDAGLTFSDLQPISLPGGGRPLNLEVGDANRDGQDDLVVVDIENSRVLIFSGSSQATFGLDVCQLDVTGTPGSVTLGDLSADGNNDIVVSIFDGNRYLVITDIVPPVAFGGGPTVTNCLYQSFDVPLPGQPSLAMVADASGDGINDLVACLAFESNVAVAHGLVGGGVGAVDLLDASGFPLRPFVADTDGNGFSDVFALSGNGDRVNLWLANDDGKLSGARNYASGLIDARVVGGADFDGDGDFEVVAGGNTTSLSLLGYDGAGLAVESSISVGSDVKQIEVIDLDLDGKPDLVVSVQGGIRVIRNRSTPGNYLFEGQGSPALTLGLTVVPSGIAFADLNGDGNNDLIVCDPASDALFILAGTSDPFVFQASVTVGVTGAPVGVVAADFSGDGVIDLAVSRSSLADIAILGNNGNLSFTETMLVPVSLIGQTPTSLVTADFNGDGRPDLVVSNTTSDTVSVLLGNVNGFAGQELDAGAAPVALLARDLTNDGILDILVASLEDGDFRILVGDGGGGFPLQTIYPGTLGAFDAVLQDMTGNGQADLVITNLLTNRVTLVNNITLPTAFALRVR